MNLRVYGLISIPGHLTTVRYPISGVDYPPHDEEESVPFALVLEYFRAEVQARKRIDNN